MSLLKKGNHTTTSNRSGRHSTASSPSPLLSHTALPATTVPFVSFSTMPDPRLKKDEEENVQEQAEHSEDENLLDVAGLVCTSKETRLNVPKSVGDSGNRILRLISDVVEQSKQKENIQNIAGTTAADVQQKEVQFEDRLPSTTDPVNMGQSETPLSANVRSEGGHLHQFLTTTKTSSLPDQVGHMPMQVQHTGVNPHFRQFFQQTGSTISLAASTNSGSYVQENSHSIQEKSSSDRALPSTVKPPSSQQTRISDSSLPSTTRQPNFQQHDKSVSVSSADFAAFAAHRNLHPMSAIARQPQQRSTANSALATVNFASTEPLEHKRGSLSQSPQAQTLAMNSVTDPFVQQPVAQTITRATSAGPSRPNPASAVTTQHPMNLNNHAKQFYILCHYRLENKEKEKRYPIGTGPLVLSQNMSGYVSYYALTQELTNQAHNPRNWFGLQEEMAKFTATIPATATTLGYLQKLELTRVVLRYDHGHGVDEETAGSYDTPISDTQELDRALHLMARRNWRDILVAYFGLGGFAPIQNDVKGKGKRVQGQQGHNDEDRASKKSKVSRSPSVETVRSGKTH